MRYDLKNCSNPIVSNSEGKEEISKKVRDQSAKFIDLVMAEVNLRVSDFPCEVPVYRQNQSLPKELLSLISRIQKQNSENKKLESYSSLHNELLGPELTAYFRGGGYILVSFFFGIP